MDDVRRFLALLLISSVATGQTYYNKTNLYPGVPSTLGSGVTTTYKNSVSGLTGTFTANSTTFTCVSGCSNIAVGSYLSGTDSGALQIWPAQNGAIGVAVATIVGTTITTNIPTNSLLTPGTYSFVVGRNRWNTTSSLLAGTIGVDTLLVGGAGSNQTWTNEFLSGDCDNTLTKPSACFLIAPSHTRNVFVAARTSDTTSPVENLENLAVNDNTSAGQSLWNNYWQTEAMAGSGTNGETHALESTLFAFDSANAALIDPFTFQRFGMLENLRLNVGQANQLYTQYNASVAINLMGIAGYAFETGINFASTALDTATLTHPPAISLPSGANGYALTWYKAAGYTTPAWQIYSTSTTRNGNSLNLTDTGVTATVVNASGTGTAVIGSASLKLTGTHSAAFTGEGDGTGLDIAAATINDPTSSGAVATGAINHIGVPTLTSTNAITIANAATLTIGGCPVASTNVTITTCEALRVFGDESRFDGLLKAGLGLTAFGAATSINASSNFATNINTGTNNTTLTLGGTTSGNNVNLNSVGIRIGNVLYASVTEPTIASGFNTSGYSITAASTAAFSVTVGTSTGTSTGVITMPTATNGWACSAADVTTPATHAIQQTATGQTSVTVTDYSRTAGTAQNMVNADVIVFHCGAF